MMKFLMIFACTYSFIRRPFDRLSPKNKFLKLLLQTILTILSLLSIVLIATLLVPFMLLKLLVYIQLKVKHRKNFGGFLTVLDSQFLVHEHPFIMHTGIVIEENDDIDLFLEELKKSIETAHDSNYPLGSSVSYTFGYAYFIKNQVQSGEILSETVLNDREFLIKEDIAQYANTVELKSKRWSVNFFKQPLLVGDDKSKNTFVVLISMHHAVMDGYNFMLFVKKYFYKKVVANTQRKVGAKCFDAQRFSLANCYLARREVIKPRYPGSLSQINGVFSEKDQRYLTKIGAIRKKFNVGYTDVIVTVFLQALSKFLEKRGLGSLDQIRVIVTGRSNLTDIANLLNGITVNPEITNALLVHNFSSPVINESSSLDVLLSEVNKCHKYVSKSLDAKFSQLLAEYIFDFLPLMFYKDMLWGLLSNSFIIFTNLGNHNETSMMGRKITQVFNVLSTAGHFGMAVLFVTNNGKLQMSFMSKQAFIEDLDDSESILNMALRYIDVLAEGAK